jgi:hypothetical protein
MSNWSINNRVKGGFKRGQKIDHPNPELNPRCLVMYVKCYQTGF